jgi:CheY-like chemotaxis protein
MIPRSVGRRRVLVIEAEPATAADLQYWLHSDLIDVEVVPSASDALTSMARRPADLVMTSTLLPPWEAVQLTAYLRSIAGRQPQVINAPYFTDSVEAAAVRRGIATLRRQVADYLRDEITNRQPLNDRLEGTQLTGQLVPVRALESGFVERFAALPALVAREDRRGAPRKRLSDLPWLRALRVPNISKVEVVDLSRTGVQIETATKLTTGSWVEIELVGPDLAMRMPARMLRTQIASVAPLGLRYRVAAAFAGSVDMPGLEHGDALQLSVSNVNQLVQSLDDTLDCVNR